MVRVLTTLVLGAFLLLSCPGWNTAAPGPKNQRKANLSGVWQGVFNYPQDSMQDPVKFTMVLIQEGDTVAGFMKEPNTFGKRKDEPFLQAVFKGKFDEKTGKLTFTKTYDGTGGEDHDVEYTATVAEGGGKAEGDWTIKDFGGTFTLEKRQLDRKTLESLK